MQESSLLATEKGAFPLFEYDKYSQTEYFKSDRIWDDTKKMIKKNGLRNAKTTTNPPLGNCVSDNTIVHTSDGCKSLKMIFTENNIDYKEILLDLVGSNFLVNDDKSLRCKVLYLILKNRFKNDSTFVEVETSEQKFEKRFIKTGLSDGINIEVLEGITKDDKLKGEKRKKIEEIKEKKD